MIQKAGLKLGQTRQFFIDFILNTFKHGTATPVVIELSCQICLFFLPQLFSQILFSFKTKETEWNPKWEIQGIEMRSKIKVFGPLFFKVQHVSSP